MNLADAFAFAMSKITENWVGNVDQQVDPERLVMEKIIMEKNGFICSNHLITQEKSIMENPGPLRELWKNQITRRKC